MTDPERTADRLRRALSDATVHIGASRVHGTELIRRGRVLRRRRTTVAAGVTALAVVALSGVLTVGLGRVTPPDVAGSRSPSPPVTPAAPSTAPASPPRSVPPPSTVPASPRTGCVAGTAACGMPDASTTGVPPGTTLTPHTGDLTIRTDGTLIDGWDLTGSLDVYADNVTVRNSRITSTNWWGINQRAGHTGLKVLHSTITGVPGRGPDHGGENYAVTSGGGAVEVGYSDLSRFSTILQVGAGRIHDNYLHDVQAIRGDGGRWQGTNGIVADAATNLTVQHNTVLNQVPANQGATCAIGLFTDSGPVSDVLVDGNLLGGGGYAFYGGGTATTGVRVTGNRFSTVAQPRGGFYGPVAAWRAGGPGNVWRDNTWADGPSAGRPVVP